MSKNQKMEQLPYSGKVYFNLVDVTIKLNHIKNIKRWISNCIQAEGLILGELSINFCSDSTLLNINIEHLNHNYYTDIITFELGEKPVVVGDIYISIDRVKENAIANKVTFNTELSRVMIHGVLHLCGYKDKTKIQKTEMRNKEDYYLYLLQK